MFWRHKKTDPKGDEPKDKEDRLLHHEGEPELEGVTDDDNGDELHDVNKDLVQHESREKGLSETPVTPVPNEEKPDVDGRVERDIPPSVGETENEDVGGGWWSRLTKGLSKSTNKLTQGITDLVTKKKLDQETLDALEELLISADLGPKTASKLVEELAENRFGKDISEEEIKLALSESIDKILEPVAKDLPLDKAEDGSPRTIIVCGVNGVGKTTTIGKLAHHIAFRQKKTALLAAGDTFRAAAIEQLQEWGKRTHVPVLAKDIGADAASVAYEAYEKAKADGADVLMIDTAGRLQNKSHLMEELQKIGRVLKKQNEGAPHEVLLVLDATTGQNAHSQVETFKEMVNVTGLVVTKLDGSARGGVLVSLADQFGLPVYAIGVGETAEDMQPFHPKEFANALLGIHE